jgi:(R,R)-butanediol dehydrogenase/meso-butanediol dehydrogenase/diacetyl reductase
MKALRLHGIQDLRLDQVSDPCEPGPSQVLLHNRLCGICGTDLHEYNDGPKLVTAEPHPLTRATMPQILGHEFSSEAIGTGVCSVSVGDRVAVMPLFFCGQCSSCREGRQECCTRLGAVGYNWAWGGMGEYAVVAEHQVTVLPEGMTDEQGAMVEPTAVAVHAVRSAQVSLGDTALVTGGGPIGQLVALAALAAGATSVYVSEPNPRRRARVEALELLTAVIDPTTDDVAARLHELHADGVDVAIECAGNDRALAACIDSVRPGSTVVQTALHSKPASIDPMRLTLRDVSLKGVNCFPVSSWPRVIALIASGRLPAERVITGRVPLINAVDGGFGALLDPARDEIKILIEL